ncbi:hypothetical protein B0H63DRAFT_212950 [Podospora didyma]|uniref:Uncharacterized protein n=1 Tax=Podospora didyma TaxID=330526 RepID=A0AAE0TW27_9PEZI|nr:hypothetical protein B0H63DRAFT_212950 [Podospora didyma]
MCVCVFSSAFVAFNKSPSSASFIFPSLRVAQGRLSSEAASLLSSSSSSRYRHLALVIAGGLFCQPSSSQCMASDLSSPTTTLRNYSSVRGRFPIAISILRLYTGYLASDLPTKSQSASLFRTLGRTRTAHLWPLLDTAIHSFLATYRVLQ